jgi:hypothetical protein
MEVALDIKSQILDLVEKYAQEKYKPQAFVPGH